MSKTDKINDKPDTKSGDKKHDVSKFTNKALSLSDVDKPKSQKSKVSKANERNKSDNLDKFILVRSLTERQVVLPYSYINKNGKRIDKSYKFNYNDKVKLPKSLVDKIIAGSYKTICELEIIG